ncbi:MAG: TlpA disulfide reductase family protein [Candidatus Paceibacterota bacterium]
MKKYLIIIVGLVALGGIVIFLSAERGGVDTESSGSAFDAFATISLVDYEGNTVSLEEFRGKPLVINSWAVWCPFCREELPDFAELQEEFGDKITVIAIDRQESLKKAKGYTDELGITDDMLFLLDSSDSFYKSIGGFSMPETIFVNSAGEIIVQKRGPMELEEMREHTNKIIRSNENPL